MIHPDKTAYRAVDACGGTHTSEQYASGYAEGYFAALDAAMEAVKKPDALMAELVDALKWALSQLDDLDEYQKRPERGDYDAECACCMGELFEPGDRARMADARAAIAKAEASTPGPTK